MTREEFDAMEDTLQRELVTVRGLQEDTQRYAKERKAIDARYVLTMYTLNRVLELEQYIK